MQNETQLRDSLARCRTKLAVERTILSYLRTSLTIVVVAVSFIKFFDSIFLTTLGWILIGLAPILFVFGLVKCKKLENGDDYK